MGALANAFGLTILSPATSQIPQVSEVRFGWAYFSSKKFTISSDLIYTSGYKMKIQNNTYDTRLGVIGISDPFANDLRRNQTLNYSIGNEYFILDNIV